MNKKEQRDFIVNFLTSVKDSLLKHSDKFPETWDGFELRHLCYKALEFEDWFSNKQYLRENKLARKRKRDCENTINVDNLI